MRGFIILCFAAVAIAAPQGYNYSPSGGQQNAGFSSTSFNSLGGSGIGLSTVGGSNGYQQGVSQQLGNFGQSSVVHQQQVQHQTSQIQQQHHNQQQHHQQQNQQQHAVISKRFYIHSAPEDSEDEYKERHITVGVPKKNYNVVFIKSPQRSNKKSTIKISPAVNEEKTVIYVLSKKSDASDIQAEVIENVAPTAKPEVFFIKYKTNEEASHAQEQIQAQYDALGGSTQILDEGVAPVSSVIGSLGGGDAAHGGSHSGAASSGSFSSVSSSSGVSGGSYASPATSNTYLPPNF